MARLKEEVDLHEIDAGVMNHNEIDHSGALPELLRHLRPGTPIYCTKKGKAIIRGHYHPEDWTFVCVKTGDTLSLDDVTMTFVEAPMLHWPDMIFTYLSGEAQLSVFLRLNRFPIFFHEFHPFSSNIPNRLNKTTKIIACTA